MSISNESLARRGAADRIEHVLSTLPGPAVMSSSFGAQSAVSLHLVTRVQPDIPVILIDTGYLFPETYRFVDQLVERLNLNLKVYRPDISPAWLESRHGKLWEKGLDGLNAYNERVKVAPMQRALREQGARIWFAGLRRQQSSSRAHTSFIEQTATRAKVHPIADWTDRDVFDYLRRHNLPYHPLWEQGYISIGDTHTTQRLQDVGDPEKTRFFGLKRECGLHEMGLSQA